MNQVDYDSRYAVGRPVNAGPDHADLAAAVAAIADAVAVAVAALDTLGTPSSGSTQ